MAATQSPTRARSTSPTAFANGEHIFVMGGTNTGLGTVGLGPEAAIEAERRQQAQQRAMYWAEKKQQMDLWRAQEEQIKHKAEQQAAMSPRRRLQIVLQDRQIQIAQEVKERKKMEEELKRQKEEEAELMKHVFTAEREAFKKAADEARGKRQAQKERELALQREKDLDLQQRHERELAELEEATAKRHSLTVALRRDERTRAVKAEKRRQAALHQATQQLRASEAQQYEAVKKTREEIVTLKGQLCANISKELKSEVEDAQYRVRQTLAENAKRLKAEEESRAKQRETAEEVRLRQSREELLAKKQAAKQQFLDYQEERRKQQLLLNQQAKEKRDRALQLLEEEKQQQQRERSEYIQSMKEIIRTRSAKTPSPMAA